MQKLRGYVGLIVFIVVAATIPIADRLLHGAQGEAVHQQLRTEWRLLKPLSDAVTVDTTDSYSPWRPRQTLVGAKYRTTEPNETVRMYYGRQLTANGWRFNDERPLHDWGRDLGGSILNYCKGAMQASLQFAGERANYGWTFAIDLSLGSGSSRCLP